MTLQVSLAATHACAGDLLAKLGDERLHSTRIGRELGVVRVDLRFENIHRVHAIIGVFEQAIRRM